MPELSVLCYLFTDGDMVQAWYMADLSADDDQRLPHKTEPFEELSLDQLKEKTGCLYWKVRDLSLHVWLLCDSLGELVFTHASPAFA